MYDYLVVGLGLAGISFCEVLEKEGKSFKVVSDVSQQASQVAGGLYNPVILKRFTLAWKAKEQMELAKPFYSDLEQKLGKTLDYKVPVLRRFASVEEQNTWFEASDKPGLGYFLSTTIIQNKNPNIDAPFGFGEVKFTGRIDTATLVESYRKYLDDKGFLVHESFDFSDFKQHDGHISYKSIQAKQIVFSCGYGLKNNPFFNYLPLNGTKGELLTIKAPDFKEENVIKSSVFSIPLGNDLYRIGATYKWKDKTNEPTEASKKELLDKLSTFLKCDFEVVDHVAGIRPTVVDRRPLVGQHPEHKNLYVLNGFGSRGVLIAPYASGQLFNFLENQEPLDPEINIQRFTKKYYNS
ncbi:FAD-binding oxidoreductase [Muricauda sp. CAU 1633]|uniref:NAD(P)/FAD-dependent oxidoreductase n=1 Tax=Allomuricauda sp. CAU 1633 TaxID=2816036 RepID=UPI001A9021E7|nr:FAD-dependent oxidoreductase [Muricauda sp. CAU 1633]MBO0321493.1 FAD-binding oxidoreductase [Muricauda sp. CAU 1633]